MHKFNLTLFGRNDEDFNRAPCRFPSSVSGSLVAFLRSPWSPPPAPSTPLPVAQVCSPTLSPVWVSLTSAGRASWASASRLPHADRCLDRAPASPQISRFPHKERPYMPSSLTTPDRPGACDGAPARVALRLRDGVGTRDKSIAARWLACTIPLTDASPASSRMPAHGSWPMWFATPSS